MVQPCGWDDVLPWRFGRLTDVFGSGVAFDVRTEADLEVALAGCVGHSDGVCIVHVHLEPGDTSAAMRRLAERFGAAPVPELPDRA